MHYANALNMAEVIYIVFCKKYKNPSMPCQEYTLKLLLSFSGLKEDHVLRHGVHFVNYVP